MPASSGSTASSSARSSRSSAAGRSGFRRSPSRSARRRRRSRTSTSRFCSSSASCSARRAGGWSPTSGVRTSARCPTTGDCSDGTETPRADAAAAAVGAVDLFVLRRVSGEQFVHFGGSGRGAGWAGIVEVATGESDALSSSLSTRRRRASSHGGKAVVFGPYYANAAAFVPVTNDVVVVFGFEGRPREPPTRRCRRPRRWPPTRSVDVTPAKRLADELEELEAVRAALAVDTEDVAEAMRHARRASPPRCSRASSPPCTSPRAGGSSSPTAGWSCAPGPSRSRRAQGRARRRPLPVLRAGCERRAAARRRSTRRPGSAPLPARAAPASRVECCSSRTRTRRRAVSRSCAGGSGCGSPTSCRLSSASRSRGSGRRDEGARLEAEFARLGGS